MRAVRVADQQPAVTAAIAMDVSAEAKLAGTLPLSLPTSCYPLYDSSLIRMTGVRRPADQASTAPDAKRFKLAFEDTDIVDRPSQALLAALRDEPSTTAQEVQRLNDMFSAPFPPMVELKEGQFLDWTPELINDISVQDMVCTLLRAGEPLAPLLVRSELSSLFQLATRAPSYHPAQRVQIQRGVSGGGKTMHLVALTQEYRRAGGLVLFIRGKMFAELTTLHARRGEIASQWIRDHVSVDLNRFRASQTPCLLNRDRSLLDLLQVSIKHCALALECMMQYLDEVQRVQKYPVMVCVDQYNCRRSSSATVISLVTLEIRLDFD